MLPQFPLIRYIKSYSPPPPPRMYDILYIKLGQCATNTHDEMRNGGIILSAASGVWEDTVIDCHV